MSKFFQAEIAAHGGEKNTFKNVDFKKNNFDNTSAAVQGTVLEFIPIHIKNPPVIQFMAYIESMSDKFGSSYTSEQPFGRTDPIYVWKSNKRDITVNWVLPSSSTAMALNNMNNLSWLLGSLYPSYKEINQAGATSVSASPMFRVRHANLISSPVRDGMGLLCVIQGVNVTHNVKAGFISVNPKNMASSFANMDAQLIKQAGFENSIREGKQLIIPKSITLNCTLNVVHDHALGWQHETGRFRGGNSGFPYQVGIMRDGDTTDNPTSTAASPPAGPHAPSSPGAANVSAELGKTFIDVANPVTPGKRDQDEIP